MRLFVAVRLKGHVPSGQGVLNATVGAAAKALDAVQPWAEEQTAAEYRWAPVGGRVAVLYRSNEPDPTAERTGWLGNKTRAWAWSGIVGSDLLESMRRSDCTTIGAKSVWGGIGSYALIGGTPDTISAFTNQHRSEALYWTTTADAVLVSNSAATLSLVRGRGRPHYSRLGIAAFLMHGLPFADVIPFEGIEVVPAGARLTSSPASDLKIIRDQPVQGESSVDEAADDIAEGLVEYARILTSGSSEVAAAITGGKDSRLVVSALRAAGIDFSSYTNGLPESGEIQVGLRVCEALGIPHRANTPPVRRGAAGGSVIVGRPEEQAWRTLRSTGGLGSAFTTLADPFTPHASIAGKANLGGQGGEIVRGGFARTLPSTDPTPDQADTVLRRTWFNNRDLLTPLAAEAVEHSVRGFFEAILIDPVAAMFDVYVTNRTGRWLATMRHGESVVSTHTTLLINNQMVRQMRCLPSTALLGERVAHAVMSRLAPQVVDLPFFRDRWAFEAQGPTSYKPESWEQRAPYTAHDQPRATFNWRSAYTKDLSAFFRSFILDTPSNLLFDVVDRSAVESMLNGTRYRPATAWALFSTQYMLSDAWLGARPENVQDIEIEVPA
ncbi:hypothetical protein [Ornithinimicrobium panacihumi]|uniref:hypothetical protein n=1 Tax=Ornithinimicrobium panacihumi TaxID=2008449 RepID=UPI003F8AC4F2